MPRKKKPCHKKPFPSLRTARMALRLMSVRRLECTAYRCGKHPTPTWHLSKKPRG